jgi:TonB-dependent receptor
MQWVSQEKLWELYQANPNYFSLDQNGAYRSLISNSKFIQEVISSAYLRADAAFFERRLRFVGGLRAEQTDVNGYGPLTDPTRNYQRDASGKVIDSNPTQAGIQPILIVPASDALGVSKLTFLDRAEHAKKEYLRLFPNINASYNLRENLIARASWYESVGRPDLNQYANGLTLPDTDVAPSPTGNFISVNNVGIKAWSAKTAKVRLEYYFERVGQISVGAFRRDFKNFFGGIVRPATPEFLALYDLDPNVYGNYYVSTNYNLTTPVKMTGVDFDYKQALTFLPQWARGVQVFANASALRLTGDPNAATNFNGFVPQTYNWGISLARPKFNLKMNWNYRGKSRGSQVTGRGIDPGTFNWTSKRLYIDLNGEYYFTKRIGLFASMRDIDLANEDFKIFGPNTPKLATFRQRTAHGSAWVFGLKGNF